MALKGGATWLLDAMRIRLLAVHPGRSLCSGLHWVVPRRTMDIGVRSSLAGQIVAGDLIATM
eukprot:8193067-Ditylum_brightwellii.AAC.1